MTNLGSRLQREKKPISPSLGDLLSLVHHSVGPGLVRTLRSKSTGPLSCACSGHFLDVFSGNASSSPTEIGPVPSCALLAQGVWNVLCQQGTATEPPGEVLCVATSLEGLGSLAIQAEVSHFARQDFRYRRFCSSTLRLGLISIIATLEGQQASERARESDEHLRNVVHSNASVRAEERERLSLQLHDTVIQSIVSAFHMVEAVREMGTHPPEQTAILQRAEETLRQAVQDLRDVIKSLHDANPGLATDGR